MGDTTQQQLDRILKQGHLDYDVRFFLTPLTWDTNEPNNPSYVAPVKGNSEDISSYISSWDIIERTRQLASSIELELRGNVDDTMLRSISINDLLEVYFIIRSGGEQQVVCFGTFFIDRCEITSDTEGIWLLAARDAAKILGRRRYFGNLEPTRIRVPEVDWVTPTRVSTAGLDYIEFFHDPDGTDNPLNRTYNWCNLPKPIFKIVETEETFLPDGENVKVLFGDGLVRMGTQWFNETIGAGRTLQMVYYRFARWEDSWANPSYNLNTPMDIIYHLTRWAGFQDNNPNGLLYIDNIEVATYPTPFDRVIGYDGTDYTAIASNDEEGTTVDLYVGSFLRRVPAIHWTLSTPSEHPITTGSPRRSPRGRIGTMTRPTVRLYTYSFWNGVAWEELPIDDDTTNDLRQSGFVTWYTQDLSTWEKSKPLAALPEAYWIKISGSPSYTHPRFTYIYAGHPIQCQDIRVATDVDLKPDALLEQLVRPSVPPNYQWGGTRDGNFRAGFDVANIADPDFVLDDDTRLEIEFDPPHEEDIKTLIVYRGQARERFNAALAMNGGSVANLQHPSEEINTYSQIINGDITQYSKITHLLGLTSTTLPSPEADLFRINLTGLSSAIILNEIAVKPSSSDDPINLTGTGVNITFENRVTDGSDVTYWEVQGDGVTNYAIDNQRFVFGIPLDINKLVVRASEASSLRFTYLRVKYDGETGWHTVASFKGPLAGIQTLTFDNLWLRNVKELMVTGEGTLFSGVTCRLHQLNVYGALSSYHTGDYDLFGAYSGVAASLDDDNINTGVTFTAKSSGFTFLLDSAGTVAEMEFHGSVAGQMLIEYRKQGSTAWLPGFTLTENPSRWVSITGLGWTDVAEIRGTVDRLGSSYTLSEIEMFLPTHATEGNHGMAENFRLRIYYRDSLTHTWHVLCPEADGFQITPPKVTIDKSNFGDELYIDALLFRVLAWGKASSGGKEGWIGEVKVWVGDTIYGKAVLGITPPYNTPADLALQGKYGWKSEVSDIDVTAVTQEIANHRALQILGEKLRLPYRVHATSFRYDSHIGNTVYLKDHVRDALKLPYNYYIIDEIMITSSGGEGNTPVVECIMLP